MLIIARDASVAFVSGDFNKDTPDQDDVLKLSPSELIGLENWKSFFDKQYEFKGLLIGRYKWKPTVQVSNYKVDNKFNF